MDALKGAKDRIMSAYYIQNYDLEYMTQQRVLTRVSVSIITLNILVVIWVIWFSQTVIASNIVKSLKTGPKINVRRFNVKNRW